MQEFYFALLGDEVKLPVYVTGVGATDPEFHCIRTNGHVYYQIIFSAKGEGILTFDSNEYRIPQGTGFYLPAGYPHEYKPSESGEWETHWISFAGACIESVLPCLEFDKPFVFKMTDYSVFDSIWQKMLKTIRTNSMHCGHTNSALLYSFLVELNKLVTCPASTKENHRMDQLKPIMDYIDQNYATGITLKELARIADLSPQYICRIFKECLNMRPFEHLTKKRIFESKKLLTETNLSINEISKAVGYNDCSYFCVVFKRQEGVSPAEYRTAYNERRRYNLANAAE